MARERVQLDAKTAKSIGRQLVERLEESGVDDRDLVHGRDFAKSWEAKKLLKEIVERINELVPWSGEPKEGWVEAAAELRTWILTHMTDDGWKRLQAARRKAEHARRNRTAEYEERLVQIRTTTVGAHLLKKIADEYQVDRAELLDKLSKWLSYEDSGKAALKRFAAEKRLQVKPKETGAL
jgi:hypothetical protein